MGKLRYILSVVIMVLGVSLASQAQDLPEPKLGDTVKSHEGPPCDDGSGGTGTPPPPGLCLPIDDYVYILMAVGVMYGCYKLRSTEFS
ncbi:hypothetical protein [Christiangramia salexigens]|uniref:Signal peptidase n=1 Tax=Christiangramia salexigens TaxID=1913577 RepID=A0A1L3J6J9_9FLAO|nr:hypothetical protein [Christiangramia salexigens]APG60768.1 hypothetical protein LPB144_10290 [Christiangramia salexigens]